jgi:tripartite-type tricarboxylate transporter receptor subunit TctC
MRKVLLTTCALLVFLAPASAQSVADFYKGKTIRLIVGIAVGSGYDVNSRLLARHLGKHIPGNPTIVVQNQPGAGSVTMTAQLQSQGPFDGTVIGAAFGGMPTIPLLQPGRAKQIAPTKLVYIGNTNRETHVSYVWHTAPVQTLDQLKTRELITGAQGPGSSQYDFPPVARALLGLRFKVVSGYGSTSKINLAIENGEIHAGIAAWTTLKTLKSKWLEEKKAKVLAQWALRPNPELPGVPNIFDLAKSNADRDAFRLVMARLDIGRPFFVPPGVPADRVAALRKAFDATMKDPAFLAEAKKLKIDIDAMTGAELAALVEQVSKTPAATVKRVRDALEAK